MNLQELSGITSEAIFEDANVILIPKKLEYNLRKYSSKKLLKTIDTDINIAVEKCLLIASNLSSTLYDDSIDGWKALRATILHEQVRKGKDNTYYYKRCLEVLKKGTKQIGPMIEVKLDKEGYEKYSHQNHQSKNYRLALPYKKGLVKYTLTTSDIKKRRSARRWESIGLAVKSPIGLNLINLYPSIELPTKKELLIEGKRLVKAKYKSNKGKRLTMRNKHSNTYWKDYSERTFVEDNIEMFNYLTERGLMIPIIGGESSGGRVVDSFTLMPSWIRKMVKVDGKPLLEADYSALHPNLAMSIYSEKEVEHISHDKVADYLGIERREAKLEHLSFFNKRIQGMEKSPLFKYYRENHSDVLLAILREKNKWYKKTTQKMFKLEVEVMSEVVSRLNEQGIFVMYVYDALYGTKKDINIIKEVMNEVVTEMKIKTNV